MGKKNPGKTGRGQGGICILQVTGDELRDTHGRRALEERLSGPRKCSAKAPMPQGWKNSTAARVARTELRGGTGRAWREVAGRCPDTQGLRL